MKAKWRLTLAAAREEALLAADMYNQPAKPRRLEAYFVHMHLAWLYMFQALYQKDRRGYHYRKSNRPNAPFQRVDGEPKTWDLAKFVSEQWLPESPIRKNLELTIGMRNKIEHRYEEATTIGTAGYAQALLLNFENLLVTWFGNAETLADALRFPIFVGTFTPEGARRIAAAQQNLPKKMRRFLADFEANLEPAVLNHEQYEFRVHLIQKTSPKTAADVSLTFVRSDQLSPEERERLEQLAQSGTVIVRDRDRPVPVANQGGMLPKAAAAAIQDRIPYKFAASSHMPRAWRALNARPPKGDPHPERTDETLCHYDSAHHDYVYTDEFVDRVVAQAKEEDTFQSFLGLIPRPKNA